MLVDEDQTREESAVGNSTCGLEEGEGGVVGEMITVDSKVRRK